MRLGDRETCRTIIYKTKRTRTLVNMARKFVRSLSPQGSDDPGTNKDGGVETLWGTNPIPS